VSIATSIKIASAMGICARPLAGKDLDVTIYGVKLERGWCSRSCGKPQRPIQKAIGEMKSRFVARAPRVRYLVGEVEVVGFAMLECVAQIRFPIVGRNADAEFNAAQLNCLPAGPVAFMALVEGRARPKFGGS